MCTVLLPPGDNPIAVNKYIYIYIYHIIDEGGWSTPSSGRCILLKETRYLFYRWLDGPQGPSERDSISGPTIPANFIAIYVIKSLVK